VDVLKKNAPIMHIPPTKEICRTPVLHNSWADWDFDNDKMFLAIDHFISPPSSLKRSFIGSPGRTVALCNHAATLNLPAGQLETYLRREVGRHIYIHLRSQQPAGTSSIEESTYVWFQEWGTICLRLSALGNKGLLPIFDYLMPNDQWVLLRVSWWTDISLYCVTALHVKLEVYEGGAWIDKGTAYDDDDWGADTGKARCGLSFIQGPIWADDTIIRGPA